MHGHRLICVLVCFDQVGSEEEEDEEDGYSDEDEDESGEEEEQKETEDQRTMRNVPLGERLRLHQEAEPATIFRKRKGACDSDSLPSLRC